jgi:hypothetical protein
MKLKERKRKPMQVIKESGADVTVASFLDGDAQALKAKLAASLVPADVDVPEHVRKFLRRDNSKYDELVKLLSVRVTDEQEFTQLALRLRQVCQQEWTAGWAACGRAAITVVKDTPS